MSKNATEMQAWVLAGFGGPEVMKLERVPVPQAGPGEVLIRVRAIGFNRADVVQREGKYPPPEGVSEILGLECSGTIVAAGAGATRFSIGQSVCALLAGGAYAQYVTVPEEQVLRIPAGLSVAEAAALPEVACTVLSNFEYGGLQEPGSSLLVHGGSGGLGTFAIQLGVALGWRVFATAGSSEGVEHCLTVGAEGACSYRNDDFVEMVLRGTSGAGVDLVFDVAGGSYLQRNIEALATGGRVSVVATLDGAEGVLDLKMLMRKRAAVQASTLRSRPIRGKGSKEEIVQAVERMVWPLIESGGLRLTRPSFVPFAQAKYLHEQHGRRAVPAGKLVLVIDEE